MLDFVGPDVSRPFVPDFTLTPTFRTTRAPGPSVAPSRTILLREGERCGGILRLAAGCVVLSQLLRDGRRQIVDVLGPGRLFAIPVAQTNLYTAETMCISQLERLDEGAVSNEEIDRHLRAMLARAQVHATLLGRKTAAEKVASAVLDLAGQFARPSRGRKTGRVTFTLHLTRADLGDWLGLTVETVSRCLHQLKRNAVIDFRHPEIITVIDRPALIEIAGLLPQDAGGERQTVDFNHP